MLYLVVSPYILRVKAVLLLHEVRAMRLIDANIMYRLDFVTAFYLPVCLVNMSFFYLVVAVVAR